MGLGFFHSYLRLRLRFPSFLGLSVGANCALDWVMPSVFYIRLRVVCGTIQSLNDLLELAAFRVNMQLLLVCHLVFPVCYSLGFCLGATLHACFASWEFGVVSLLLCCRYCIIGMGPHIRIAIIACVTDC